MDKTWSSERLIYRAFEPSTDDKFLHSLYTDPDVFINAINLLPRPWGTEEMAEARKSMMSGALMWVTILKIPESKPVPIENGSKAAGDNKAVEKPAPVPVGLFSLRDPPMPNLTHHRSTVMGITIAKEHHGHGYGPEAIRWGVDWAFRMAGMHRVGLQVYEYNAKAYKLYKRLGFIEEGREREGCWYDGKWWDVISMGVLAHEWGKC
jgi:RimJ/RimL family protein N-acetyltransferase